MAPNQASLVVVITSAALLRMRNQKQGRFGILYVISRSEKKKTQTGENYKFQSPSSPTTQSSKCTKFSLAVPVFPEETDVDHENYFTQKKKDAKKVHFKINGFSVE